MFSCDLSDTVDCWGKQIDLLPLLLKEGDNEQKDTHLGATRISTWKIPSQRQLNKPNETSGLSACRACLSFDRVSPSEEMSPPKGLALAPLTHWFTLSSVGVSALGILFASGDDGLASLTSGLFAALKS